MPLAQIMIALNQNVVKTETSKAFTPLERRAGHAAPPGLRSRGAVLRAVPAGQPPCARRLVRRHHRQSHRAVGGAQQCLPADGDFAGVGHEGMHRALRHHGYDDAVILVSRLGHYSLNKAADVLGIGESR